jgi:hypothetical protein
MRPASLLAPALALLALGACGNPVDDVRIDALGPEVDGVPPSEFHRPGQPCLLCHGEYQGAEPRMSVAGTVFATPQRDKKKPPSVEGVTVTITDSFGDSKTKKTNCIGNFFIKADEWQPGFPLAAKIEYPNPDGEGTKPVYMSTRIGRDGSCAGCHVGERSQTSPGVVFCVDEATNPFPKPGDDCKGVP